MSDEERHCDADGFGEVVEVERVSGGLGSSYTISYVHPLKEDIEMVNLESRMQ